MYAFSPLPLSGLMSPLKERYRRTAGVGLSISAVFLYPASLSEVTSGKITSSAASKAPQLHSMTLITCGHANLHLNATL